jgi:hypothetical protein
MRSLRLYKCMCRFTSPVKATLGCIYRISRKPYLGETSRQTDTSIYLDLSLAVVGWTHTVK